ncbi:hypothetical protein Forpe1208_v007031 [Fusarium oxysporum f. sp. rapae]|uniref:Uncharacterized protein n=1 Tax=Fusarium oxysporum f. sp. rapae TaxID=485398 RepID=A0A8J5NVF8_FUSOX|nr:hypothetical protein Forpe1208_v007031 [Fusarium oxysporum f. sp. rapae]
MPTTTTKWSNKNAVDTEKLVFRHEFPVKRFCRLDKLRDALCDIFGSGDWLVEATGNNVAIKVGRRVDLEEELKARHVIFNSMGIARAVSFFELFEYIRY